MHVVLTDVLTCPRCGPNHGLVLLPEGVDERRVATGFLGCADCRTRYPIHGGVAELAVAEALPGAAADGTAEGAVRLAGLLGLAEAEGVVVVVGPAARHAAALASLVEGVEVIATLDGPAEGVSAARLGGALPFHTARIRAVALTGEAASSLLEEGARVVAVSGRLLLDPAPADAEARLEAAGLRVLGREGDTVVAAR